ncbi:uncharacterized protein DFL_006594 [Arthrobotrys flagrans]|uniref:Uncharacterized protein n=1 Tax=Arthrobotrys flagrans TaxID=97331 RepID=A0A436ZT87_ARTFL|nr:hypothetical protein DFL_006594 [Arthrobotrys flagrans]
MHSLKYLELVDSCYAKTANKILPQLKPLERLCLRVLVPKGEKGNITSQSIQKHRNLEILWLEDSLDTIGDPLHDPSQTEAYLEKIVFFDFPYLKEVAILCNRYKFLISLLESVSIVRLRVVADDSRHTCPSEEARFAMYANELVKHNINLQEADRKGSLSVIIVEAVTLEYGRREHIHRIIKDAPEDAIRIYHVTYSRNVFGLVVHALSPITEEQFEQVHPHSRILSYEPEAKPWDP